jgi:hypothetical protein
MYDLEIIAPEIRRLKQHDALCDYQKENSFVPK